MTSTEQIILQAAAKNKELLGILAETDHGPPALEQQKKYIADLKNEIKQLDRSIQQLELTRKKELKEHEKYRDSTMKRFAYKVSRKTDKFEAKASKEEQEYFQALQEETRAREARKSTAAALTQAESTISNLESVVSRHKQAQKELDDLYDSIFSGPTPSFPEEDAKEREAERALNIYHNTREQFEAETQAANILLDATKKMQMAKVHMESARDSSRMDMFGGGTMMDMMERSSLGKADNLTMETQMLIMQAQRMSPMVQPIPKPQIAQGSLMSDVMFDNIFSDMDFHEKIKASQIEVGRCAEAVIQEHKNAVDRWNHLKEKVAVEGRTLEETRVALQRAREQAFERTVGSKA